MTEKEFCYWLKGFFELMAAGPKCPDKLVLTANQVEMIDKHLRSVFAEKIMQEPLTFEYSGTGASGQGGGAFIPAPFQQGPGGSVIC
jgi:hypothetical protein